MSAHISGPAFPVPGLQNDAAFNGMSLRDYFAAKAMGAEQWGMPHMHDHITVYDRVAEHAYKMADAMLKARSA